MTRAVVSLTPQPPILTGRVIEIKTIGANTKKLINEPTHEYTKLLINSVP